MLIIGSEPPVRVRIRGREDDGALWVDTFGTTHWLRVHPRGWRSSRVCFLNKGFRFRVRVRVRFRVRVRCFFDQALRVRASRPPRCPPPSCPRVLFLNKGLRGRAKGLARVRDMARCSLRVRLHIRVRLRVGVWIRGRGRGRGRGRMSGLWVYLG